MVLASSIEVRTSGISGKGLYAKAKIAKGEHLWWPDPDEQERYWKHIDVIRSWPEEEQKHFMNGAYLVAKDTYSGVMRGQESDCGEFMNHSCDPNCVFVGDFLCVATRDIAVDEEITYDYATSETEDSSHMPFDCRCGASTCRGRVTGRDYLDAGIRAKYAGHFTTLVDELHKAADAAAATADAAASVPAPATAAAAAGGAAATA